MRMIQAIQRYAALGFLLLLLSPAARGNDATSAGPAATTRLRSQ